MRAELTLAEALARRDAWEPWLRAVVRWLDPPVAGARSGPLAGVVTGVKDLIAVAGVPRRCGAPELTDPGPQPAHATAVGRLLAAGAVVAATLELHQLAYGVVCPQTRNPRAPDRIAGGSSGGSAAALAAGLVEASIGTDTGGSVRIPAACCGVVGLKTTRGLVPLTGVQALAPSLDTVGPMARSVAAVAALLDVLAGYDPADPYSRPAPPPPPRPRPARIGIPVEVLEARMDEDVRAVWESVLDDLAAGGLTVTRVAIPALRGAHRANGLVLAAEAAWVHAEAFAAAPQHFWPSVASRLAHGRDLRATALAAAHHDRARLRADLRRVFATVDVLVVPTLPCRTPPAGRDPLVVGGEEEPVVTALTRFTNPYNLAGVPAGTVPAGTDADGAPVGVQVVGPWSADATVLGVMATVEELRGGPWPRSAPPERSSPER